MTEDKKMGDALDACPFPPGSEPPEERYRLVGRLLNFYDEFFGNWKIVLSVLTAASLVLAYSLLTVPPPPVSLPSEPDTWGRPIPKVTYWLTPELAWKPKFEKQIVREEDLILEGDDVLVVENCTYILNGEFLARDRARLIIRNAELFVQEKRSWVPTDLLPATFCAVFNNSASLEMVNSSIHYPGRRLSIGFFQSSEATLDSSALNRTFLRGHDHSKLKITNSEVGGLTVTNDSICEVLNSEITEIDCFSPYHHSLIGHFLIGVWDTCRVEVWNSTVERVYFEFKNCTSATATSAFRGYHRFWNSYQNFSVDGSVFNITLHNTNITGTGFLTLLTGLMSVENREDFHAIRVWNGTLQISNCTISDSLGGEEGSKIEVEDGVFKYLFLMSDAQFLAVRSKLDNLILDEFKGSAVFDNVLIDRVLDADDCECYINGDITFGENASKNGIRLERGVITRNFEVVTQREGRALPQVKLVLYDKENTSIWRGKSDRDGKATFNISFCSHWPLKEPYKYVTNYKDLWRLEASMGKTKYNVSLGFLSDTPIVCTFPSLPKPFSMKRELLAAVSASTIVLVFVAYLRKNLTARTRRVE